VESVVVYDQLKSGWRYKMASPDFIIVGAPKSGTTSLQRYLSGHPSVFMVHGEPHYFGRDVDYWPERITYGRYLSLFDDASSARFLGEKSVFYLYSRLAAEEIAQHNPDTKIIIMLRNPVDMLHSLHGMYYAYERFENIKSFEKALMAEPARKKDRKLSKDTHFRQALYYSEIGQYADQVERYFERFPRENIKVIIYEDFKERPLDVFRETIAFLGLQGDYLPEVVVHNQARVVRSHTMKSILAAEGMRKALKASVPRVVLKRLSKVYRALREWNVKQGQRKPISVKTRRELFAFFERDISRLSEMLDVDLFRYWNGSR